MSAQADIGNTVARKEYGSIPTSAKRVESWGRGGEGVTHKTRTRKKKQKNQSLGQEMKTVTKIFIASYKLTSEDFKRCQKQSQTLS